MNKPSNLLKVAAGICIVAILVTFSLSRSEKPPSEETLSESSQRLDLQTEITTTTNPRSDSRVSLTQSNRLDSSKPREHQNKTPGAKSNASRSRDSGDTFWENAKIPADLITASLPLFEDRSQLVSRRTNNNSTGGQFTAPSTPPFAGGDGNVSENETLNPDDLLDKNEELFLWMLREPEAALEWLNTQDELERFDHAFELIGHNLSAHGHPQLGLEWIALINDPNKKRNAEVDLYAGAPGISVPSHLAGAVLNSDSID